MTTASAKLLEPVMHLAQHYRLAPARILEAASLSQSDYSKPGVRFPTQRYADVLSLLVEASNNPHIALSLAEATQPRMLGSIGFLMSTSATLGKAYQTLIDYLPLLMEGAVLQMEPVDDGVLLTLELNHSQLQPVEYLLGCLINWSRWLTGQQIPARCVRFAFPEPQDIQPYQRFFAAEVESNALRNQLLLPSDYLSLACLEANEEMHQLHLEFADSLLSKMNQQGALIAQTRNLIRRQLNEGGGTVRRDEVAETLGMSLRTLQRKLGILGTSFQDVYDVTRRDVALQLIQRGQMSFGEIAFQLGFSNQSAFQKAFKRWMGVAPSLYRQQVNPISLVVPEALLPDHITDQGLNVSDISTETIDQRLSSINDFSLSLLEWAALLGEYFDLQSLSEITHNPVARLAIHLWPVEQQGLIQQIKSSADDVGRYRFNHPDILTRIIQRLNKQQREDKHRTMGERLLNLLQDNPITDDSLPLVETCLHHLNALALKPSDPLFEQVTGLNLRASELTEALHKFKESANYLSYLFEYKEKEECLTSSPKRESLLSHQAHLWFRAGEIDKAQVCLNKLKEANTLPALAQRALLLAQIHQQQNNPEEALSLLMQALADIDQPLPSTAKTQLPYLLTQLDAISVRFNGEALQRLAVEVAPDELFRLSLLEQILLMATQSGQPLLAACAAGRMTQLSLEQGRSSLTPFAFISYAWVASWVCGDYPLARLFAAQGVQLANRYGGLNHPSGSDPDEAALHAMLLYASRVQHWLAPLDEIRHHVEKLALLARENQFPTVLQECNLLHYQLRLLGAESLETIGVDSDNAPSAALSDILDLPAYLLGHKAPSEPDTLEYQNGWQAMSHVIAALLLDQQCYWNTFYLWEGRVENEMSGYFSVSELLFCTAMMRLIQGHQNNGLGPRRKVEVEQILSRFELWRAESPANFSFHYSLLVAENARLQGDSPTLAFEEAILMAEKQEGLFHKALAYERYGDYLHVAQQRRLARFCTEEALTLYRDWGACEKVKQLEYKRVLLAE